MEIEQSCGFENEKCENKFNCHQEQPAKHILIASQIVLAHSKCVQVVYLT